MVKEWMDVPSASTVSLSAFWASSLLGVSGRMVLTAVCFIERKTLV